MKRASASVAPTKRPKPSPKARRPRMDAEARKTHRVTTRYTQAEREQLALKCSRAGMTESAFVRAASLGRKVEAREKSDPDFALVQQLLAIGKNLNQLTKIANTTKRMPVGLQDVIADLQSVLSDRITK